MEGEGVGGEEGAGRGGGMKAGNIASVGDTELVGYGNEDKATTPPQCPYTLCV